MATTYTLTDAMSGAKLRVRPDAITEVVAVVVRLPSGDTLEATAVRVFVPSPERPIGSPRARPLAVSSPADGVTVLVQEPAAWIEDALTIDQRGKAYQRARTRRGAGLVSPAVTS